MGSISSITTLWMPEVVHYFKENYPKVKIEILDGNYDEIREWIIRGQVDCGFLSSIVADDLKFYRSGTTRCALCSRRGIHWLHIPV